jgi:colanic acid/amylovoran biosynthesis glycosyltransferase
VRLAYLTSQYSAPSHTFIRREVEALERRGLMVHTFSVRPPERTGDDDSPAAQAARRTWSILPVAPLAFGRAHLWALGTRPRRYARTLVDAVRHRTPGARAMLWSLFHFCEAVVLARELDRRGIEHLHNHFANAGANVGYLATRYLGVGWSLTLHGISELDYPSGPLLPDKIATARFVACASRFMRAQAMRMVEPAHWDKLCLVRCGVQVDDSAPGRFPGRADGPLRVLHVGRLAPEKGQLGLLEAVARGVARGFDLHLRIGGEGPARAELERAIRALGLHDRVTLLGRLDEGQVHEEMARADAFVLSSFMEGLPVVLMEAMAAGLPVVAPRVAGIPELVEDERSGLLFHPADWDGLCEGLCRLGSDADLRRRLGEEGRVRVRAEFQIDRVVEPLLEELARWTPRAAVVELPLSRPSHPSRHPEVLDGTDAIGQTGQIGRQVDHHEADAPVAAEAGPGGR